MNGETHYLGVVQGAKFQQLAPEPDPIGPHQFTSIHMQEQRSPQSGRLNLTEYEGSAVMIRGHGGGVGLLFAGMQL